MTMTSESTEHTAPTVTTATPTPALNPFTDNPEQHPGQWRMERIELLNWGTFTGHWTLPVARKGYLITGRSGSGKSSVLDAVSAVLTPRMHHRFNAAANDGQAATAGGRSLVTYIRGAWTRSTDDETGDVASEYLRPAGTGSGVLVKYTSGDGAAPVLLVKLYFLRRGAQKPADVSELSLILREEAGLDAFVPYLQQGLETRKLKADWSSAYEITTQHSRFAARFQRLLGITGDNAVLLLNKTQSAKSLGNLDDLFRKFMLNEPPTFATADNAIAQFQELSQAHHSVVQARQQRDHLQQMAEHAETYQQGRDAAAELEELSGGVHDVKNDWKLRLTADALQKTVAQRDDAARAESTARDDRDAHQQQTDRARQAVHEQGGDQVALLDSRIDLAEERLDDVEAKRRGLSEKLGPVGLTLPETAGDWDELRRTAEHDRDTAHTRHEEAQQREYQLFQQHAEAQSELRATEKDIDALRHSRSNLNRRLLDARRIIAEAAKLPVSSLPFAGELIDVRTEYRDWTGAIERVLRPLATVLLVPQAHDAAVRRAVDSQHLGARVQYEVVPSVTDTPKRIDSDQSLVNRVEVAEHALRPWLVHHLSARFDYACVETPDELAAHERAVTRAGQVRRGRTRYEKDDRSQINDRRNWYLGSDTEAKLEHLIATYQQQKTHAEQTETELTRHQAQTTAARRRVEVLAELDTVEWKSVDLDAARRVVTDLVAERNALLADDGDLQHARSMLQEAEHRLETARSHLDESVRRLAALEAEAATLQTSVESLRAQVREIELSAPQQQRLREMFTERATKRRVTHEQIDDLASTVVHELHRMIQRHADQTQRAAEQVSRLAVEFKNAWPAVAADFDASVADWPGYRQVLDRIVADDLPRFEDRFFELLTNQSQQNIGQLASQIRRARAEIRERVAPVNESLQRSEFDRDRFLHIQVRDHHSPDVREFLADLQTISAGVLQLEERAEAEQRFERMNALMTRLASSERADRVWREKVLDTRLHVRFIAQELDPTGQVQNVHDNSAGLSGGQQQKLVTFCLAAALRYQLTDGGKDLPNYATVMMDEAFDKADAEFTRMAMDVFTTFGFHMVLVTPLKLIRTLAPYIGGAAAISCLNFKDSRIGRVTAVPPTEPEASSTADDETPVAAAREAPEASSTANETPAAAETDGALW